MINGIPAANRRGRDDLEAMGFFLSESYFNEINQLCHMIMVTINATESVNASRIRCDYCPTGDQPNNNCSRSDEATLLVIPSKVFFYYKYRYDNVINI